MEIGKRGKEEGRGGSQRRRHKIREKRGQYPSLRGAVRWVLRKWGVGGSDQGEGVWLGGRIAWEGKFLATEKREKVIRSGAKGGSDRGRGPRVDKEPREYDRAGGVGITA